jgi:acyl-CoA reductase-like NAD-dependent aldehyde dehydrogenase
VIPSDKSIKAIAGDPLLPESTKGPVISQIQHSKIMGHIRKGIEQGSKLLHGGKQIDSKGNFIENTAFVDVREDTSLMQEEIFGPVAVSCFLNSRESFRLTLSSRFPSSPLKQRSLRRRTIARMG